MLVLQKLLAESGQHLFNLGNHTGYSVQQVIDLAKTVTARSLLAHVVPRLAGDPPMLVASAEKARKELGWQRVIPSCTGFWSTPGPGTNTFKS